MSVLSEFLEFGSLVEARQVGVHQEKGDSVGGLEDRGRGENMAKYVTLPSGRVLATSTQQSVNHLGEQKTVS